MPRFAPDVRVAVAQVVAAEPVTAHSRAQAGSGDNGAQHQLRSGLSLGQHPAEPVGHLGVGVSAGQPDFTGATAAGQRLMGAGPSGQADVAFVERDDSRR